MAAESGGAYDDDVPNADGSTLKSDHTASVLPSAASTAVTCRHRTNRPVYTQLEFHERYNFTTEDKSISQQMLEWVNKKCAQSELFNKKTLLSFFPFIGIMRHYNLRGDLFSDIIAGLTVGIMHIPQGQ